MILGFNCQSNKAVHIYIFLNAEVLIATYKKKCAALICFFKDNFESTSESSEIDALPSGSHVFECTASIQIFISVFLINYADQSSQHESDFPCRGLGIPCHHYFCYLLSYILATAKTQSHS